MKRVALTIAAIAALGLAGCGESGQVVVYKQGKYQGKPDGRPWDSAPPAQEQRGGTWNKGDKNSWETALNARTLAQNEYPRIYNQ